MSLYFFVCCFNYYLISVHSPFKFIYILIIPAFGIISIIISGILFYKIKIKIFTTIKRRDCWVLAYLVQRLTDDSSKHVVTAKNVSKYLNRSCLGLRWTSNLWRRSYILSTLILVLWTSRSLHLNNSLTGKFRPA